MHNHNHRFILSSTNSFRFRWPLPLNEFFARMLDTKCSVLAYILIIGSARMSAFVITNAEMVHRQEEQQKNLFILAAS